MKKRTIFSLVAVLIITLSACGVAVQETEESGMRLDDEKTEPSMITSETQKFDEKNEENDAIAFQYSYKVPGKKIVVDVPNWQEQELGYTRLFVLHGVKYVAVTSELDVEATDLKAAHEDAFAMFKECIQNYSYVNFLTVEDEEWKTINGIDVYKYEGTLNCSLDYWERDNSYEAYVIGYSFIMDGVPCNVTGSVIDQAQEQDMIDEMKSIVEAMIQTLRSER